MRSKNFTVGVAIAALVLSAPAPAQLRSCAGVVAGNASIGPQFQCATSGPTVRSPWFAGLSLPTEGIAACGLIGQVSDLSGLTGPIVTTAAATGPMAGVGTCSRSAKARAEYWSLGIAASGVSTGDASRLHTGRPRRSRASATTSSTPVRRLQTEPPDLRTSSSSWKAS